MGWSTVSHYHTARKTKATLVCARKYRHPCFRPLASGYVTFVSPFQKINAFLLFSDGLGHEALQKTGGVGMNKIHRLDFVMFPQNAIFVIPELKNTVEKID